MSEVLYTYADLSTAHLPEQEMRQIVAAPPTVTPHEYGAWVHVGEEFEEQDWEDFPALRRVIEWARERDARWINFDADGDTVDGLPTWEW